MLGPIAFTGHGLDRDDHARADPARLAELRASPAARLLLLDGLTPRYGPDDALQFGGLEEAAEDAELVFLGLMEGAPLFAAVPGAGDLRPAYEQRAQWVALGLLAPAQLALYGGARSLADWHARHRFCARCGQPTRIAKGGWQRDCTSEACAAQHFPRTDPVAIMLVEHDGDLLLGRSARFPARSYSALAGFVEPGESVEEAVAREVFEEAGVRAHSVRYVASQPWPFPSQLMLGCHALADARQLVIDYTELEDARWFTRAEVADALANGPDAAGFLAPPRYAIAHHLLAWWLENTRT